jgi:hypothetical protein
MAAYKKLDRTEATLSNTVYFGIQCPFLKNHILAFHINKLFQIELEKSKDFVSYTTEQSVAFPYYAYVSEVENCTYHLIGPKSKDALFSNYPDMDFWLLVRFEDGLTEQRLASLKEKLYDELCQLEQVFLVVQAEPEKLANHDYFLEDFSLYYTQLLRERQEEEKLKRSYSR